MFRCPAEFPLFNNAKKHTRLNRCNFKDPAKEKICPHCKKEFARKSNRDRHVQDIHYLEENGTNVSAEENFAGSSSFIREDVNNGMDMSINGAEEDFEVLVVDDEESCDLVEMESIKVINDEEDGNNEESMISDNIISNDNQNDLSVDILNEITSLV